MDPCTLVPPEGVAEGYGLRDEALDQLLITSAFREITLQFRPAIKVTQEAFRSDIRIRVIALPYDEERNPPWPHLAWVPLWSNRDTCVLVTDPLEPPTRHDSEYFIPLGFAHHCTHINAKYPYYLPNDAPDLFWPRYLTCHPISVVDVYPKSSTNTNSAIEKSASTLFVLLSEILRRLRAYVADHLLIQNGFATGVWYHHSTLLYELPLPDFTESEEFLLLFSFLLVDAARAVATISHIDHFTWTGLTRLVENTQRHFYEVESFVGQYSKGFKFTKQFELLSHYFTSLNPDALHNPLMTSSVVSNIFNIASFNIDDEVGW